MADQPDRDKQERAAAAVLLLLFGDYMLRRWNASEFAQAAGDGLEPIFTEVYDNARDRMIEELDLDWPGRSLARSAKSHARRVGREVAAAIGGDLRRKNLTADDLAKIFSKARADRAATTEITTAISRGEIETADVIKDVFGSQPDAIWRIESGACPACRKLRGKRRRVWIRTAPDGPPLHPHCRCWLEWVMRLRR